MEEIKFQLLSSIIKDPVNFVSMYRSLDEDIRSDVEKDLVNVGSTVAKILLNFQKSLAYIGLDIPGVVDLAPKVFSLLPSGNVRKEKNINNLLDQGNFNVSLHNNELEDFCKQLVSLSKLSNTSKIEEINLFEDSDLLTLFFGGN